MHWHKDQEECIVSAGVSLLLLTAEHFFLLSKKVDYLKIVSIAFSIAPELNFRCDFGIRTVGKSKEEAFKILGTNKFPVPKMPTWPINLRLCIALKLKTIAQKSALTDKFPGLICGG